jgi:hypothetical protein
MAINRSATRPNPTPLPPAAAVPVDSRHRQGPEIALRRTSRYRAHDDDQNETPGCLGAPARHAPSSPETPEEWT